MFVVSVICLNSCYSVQINPNGINNVQVSKVIQVACSPEIVLELLSRCSAVRPPHRWCIEDTAPFNYYTTAKI